MAAKKGITSAPLTDEERKARQRQSKRESAARYRARHRETIRAKKAAYSRANKSLSQTAKRTAIHRAYVAKNREAIRLYQKAYIHKYREKVLAQKRASYIRNREAILARRRLYVATHQEERQAKVSAYHKAYRHIHREKVNAKNAARRAREQHAPINDLTAEQWAEIKAAYDSRCVYCDRKLQRLTKDHLTPLASGGAHTFHNIAPACGACNSKKRNGKVLSPVQPLLLVMAPPKRRKT